MKCSIYKVGGFVRDQLLGRESNDLDFVFVIEDTSITDPDVGFTLMREWMLAEGYTIFLETPECFTIRGRRSNGEVGDFVLARKEVGYIPDTRRPILELGSLYDDLERRDFTVNAMAMGDDGVIIDPFNGKRDISLMKLRTPIDPKLTLADDPLRALRALRFSVILDFTYTLQLGRALASSELPELTRRKVSTDRIRQELTKCFKYDNWKTFCALHKMPGPLVESWLGRNGLWLKPTTEKSNNERA